MTPYRTLLIDDELSAREVLQVYLQTDPSVVVTAEAANGTEAVRMILQQRPDLIFLDIQMPELDGFGVLREIWTYHQPVVVFTTAYDQYALRAFEVNAIDYLLKPFNDLRFFQALERAKERLRLQSQPDMDALLSQLHTVAAPAGSGTYLRRMLVKENGRMFFVDTADIRYFDAEGNYITLHTGRSHYTIYDSLTNLETQLDPLDFVRIHRSYIINVNYIKEVETHYNGDYVVRMQSGEVLKWTRNYRDNLKAFYGKSR
ncbi:DNA-binding response regulator [Fibrisoma montanum]|uniref:DNA-binding response regulator n=1 Tax=Fibrisoma montanum TaxID=2305895 RepID=A0A418M2B8_9BACT|nr:LytTR family DNA-binding domain-containing protein [Fibrisoma montanum]RIV19699.1 DNA-binding response regulator [Fibrisoma montanum]